LGKVAKIELKKKKRITKWKIVTLELLVQKQKHQKELILFYTPIVVPVRGVA
jgi:hypothetical protein